MTKAEVITELMEKTGLSRQEAGDAVEVFLEQIRVGLQRGERVSLVGFGSFFLKEQRARNGRNPRTGESISIPRKLVTVFKPGKEFRESVDSAMKRQEESRKQKDEG